MVRGIIKIAVGIGAGIIAIANRKRIKKAAVKTKDAIADLFSGPDLSSVRAPHVVIDGMDTVEDYVYLKSDLDFVVNLSKRIEHDLRVILGYDEDYSPSLGILMGEADDNKVFGDDEDLYNSLNNFRRTRNKHVHGEGTEIEFKFRLEWTLAVFKLEESVEDQSDDGDEVLEETEEDVTVENSTKHSNRYFNMA